MLLIYDKDPSSTRAPARIRLVFRGDDHVTATWGADETLLRMQFRREPSGTR